MVSTGNCSTDSRYETCHCYGNTSRTRKKTPNKLQEKVGTRLVSLNQDNHPIISEKLDCSCNLPLRVTPHEYFHCFIHLIFTLPHKLLRFIQPLPCISIRIYLQEQIKFQCVYNSSIQMAAICSQLLTQPPTIC